MSANPLLILAIAASIISCEGKKGIPKKPFYVIGIEPSGSDYRVFYIDADSNQYSFEMDWLDHGKYKPGDIIE